ncbi:1-phosphatidylinositol-3-phosphate 5-kinase FAB1B-like isoform X1 [Chenopodium quinoa]|uniref:1-phosphatidylinositol-3-phosphate 5-kinase FAB1B-like isoform X1 n=1 Tax=Chenopodium quinoa TaxID=63459 RepID=UPI000B7796AD|nr:1-phosphatidylinositol-3-phosphate 5-kinase FAB1B-like isoform X1 [Chenopodium quinoa]
MGSPDKKLLGIVNFWGPRKCEPANVSRVFWMPDQSCRVCYECDSQFTVFNRRHHCRLCGRVFCAKCTAHSIPILSDESKSDREDSDRIRVCNYCFRQWEQGLVTDNHETGGASSPGLSPSPSAISLGSLNTSFTGDSIASTVNSMAYSTGPYEHVTYGSSTNLEQSSQSGQHNQNNGASDPISINTYVDVGDLSSNDNQYGLCVNRSDDEENANGGYFGAVNFDELDNIYQSCKGGFDGESDDRKAVSPLSSVVFGSEFLEGIKASANEPGIPNNNDESEASLYGIENADVENLDFENNGLLWIPPEPEDEDDDREADLFDDEDDRDAGEWAYQSSSSSVVGELQREKANEEHRKAMRNVVGGHFRALITQLLQVENLPVRDDDDKESWLDIITSLSWEAASLLKPDMTKGSGMDPGGYVKVKCLACGKRSNSLVVKGVVCKKNVAHRRMTAKFDRPRLLILGGALEYQRVSTHLSSFDTLLQQEMDHLKMAVAKISSLNPNILLVEKSVSRFAQEYLLEQNISLVLNIKRPLLERIARCSGTQIVPSVDHLKSQTLGYCESFHVDKYFEEHGSADQGGKKLTKTLMFFEGCPKPLGCTILLKGASGDELKKVKHVVQYGIFAAYHLALETSYLADEGASLPELPLKSPITVALPDKPLNINRSISTVYDLVIPPTERPQSENSRLVSHAPSLITTSTVPISERNQSSSLNEYMESSLNCVQSIVDSSPDSSLYDVPNSICNDLPQDGVSEHVSKSGVKFFPESHSISVKPDDCLPDDYAADSSFSTSLPSGHSVCKRNDDYSAATEPNPSTNLLDLNYSDQNEKVKLLKEEFSPSPSDGHSILVSLTTRCVWKGVVCERAHLFRIKYYRSFDKPLGRFLLDDLFDQNYRCRVCEMPSEAHIHCYTHQQGSLTISVRKLTEFPLPGERDGKIWMWHRCLRCPRVNGFPPATRRIVMSDAAWGLSFGKFLELSFSNHAAASRVASCGHSLHKDCLRFYGCGRMVACFRYAPIVVNSVFLPPSNLEFTCANLEWIQKEADEVNDQAELLYTEVCNCINEISEKFSRSGLLESNIKACGLRKHIMELDKILRKEKEEFEESLQKALQSKRQDGIDILEINRLRLHLLIQSYVWDQRLIFASSLDAKITHYGSDSPILKSMEETCNYVEKTSTNAGGEVAREVGNCGSVILDGKIGTDLSQGVNIKEFNKMMCKEDLHGIKMGEADPANSVNAVQRISAGQFPIGVNLSDTLDAAWIGEILSGSANPKENDAIDTSSSVRSVAASPNSEKHNDARDETEIHHATGIALPPMSSDFLESSTDWLKMPFMNIYQYTAWNAQKLDALGDYNPVFVSSFRELKRLGGARLLLPVGVDHTVIPVYDDEPTSIIAYALVSPDYKTQISDDPDMKKDGIDSAISLTSLASSLSLHPFEAVSGSMKSFGSSEESLLSMSGSRNSLILDPLFYTKALHARVSFSDNGPLGKVKYTVTCYYAKRFEALRKICCPSEMDFIRSLSRCKKWGAQGGKSNVFFAKSLDDRFIIKQVTKTELESFIKFAPAYFKYLSESIESCSPTCLAKILGIYQVTSKHIKGGKEFKMDVLVMENLLFRRNVVRLYDLKGSCRSRYNPDSTGGNKVLLDQNLIETMPTSPIFVGNKAKRLLERAVWNDTSFLASIDVMDYSLLVGIDEEKQELVVGIIDFMRQYTWDKHLETWVKASGILGGPKNAQPTVISPDQYKKRFRKAMTTYFLMVPDQWSPPTILPSEPMFDVNEEN